MNEEDIVEQEQEVVETEASAETEKADKQEDIKIPKSRFDQVNEKLKATQAELEKFRKEAKKAETEAQKEQGKYRELYESVQADLEKQKAAYEQLERDSVRREVASEMGYPALWNRLQGGNREELEADMQKLLDAMPKPKAPSLNGAAGAKEKGSPSTRMTEAEKKEFAATFGLRPQDIPDI